jgi:multisubunit Na+/H+ antiporter MnhG subunit
MHEQPQVQVHEHHLVPTLASGNAADRDQMYGERAQPGHLYDQASPSTVDTKGADMIILGVILLVLGLLLDIQILYILGIILAIIGVVLFVLGRTGRAVGGRKHWF